MSSKYLFPALLILASASWSQSYGSGQDAATDSEGFVWPTTEVLKAQNQNTPSGNNRRPSGFVLPTAAFKTQNQNTAANNSGTSGFVSIFPSAGVSPQNDPLVRPSNDKSPNNNFNYSTNSARSNNGRNSVSFNSSVTTSPAFNALIFECRNDGQRETISALAACVQQEQEEEKRIQILVDDFVKKQKITDSAIRDLLYKRLDDINHFLEAVKPVDAAQSPMNYYGAAKKYFTDHISSFSSSKVLQVSTHCTQLENIASALNAKRKLPENITYPNDRDSFLEGELC